LRALPRCEPPAAVWDRIQAELAHGTQPQRKIRRRWTHMALAASVLLAAVVVLFAQLRSQRNDESAVTERPLTAALRSVELAALVAESERLERELIALPRIDGVVRAGTASTIAGLEDHIAFIDAELSASEALDADPIYRQALWQERIEVMNALVDVQYAQLPAAMLFQ
jgi:hypothetical protein